MSKHEPVWERPDVLRERARWYRAYAGTQSDRAWALWLAAQLERRAGELEAVQARKIAKPDEPA